MDIAIVVPLRVGACGGVVKHLQNILREWQLDGFQHKVTVYLPEQLGDFSSLPSGIISTYPVNDFRRRFKTLRKAVANGNHDVALVVTARYIDLRPLPTVIMMRNSEPLQSIDYPVSLYWRARLVFYRWEHWQACRKATRVLAVSQYIKQRLGSLFSCELNNIDVVPHGLGSEEISNPGHTPVCDLQPGKFIFTGGVLAPYRGLEDIIRAYGILKHNHAALPPVAVAGAPVSGSYRYLGSLHRLAADLGVSQHFIWLGKISREEMSWCCKNSQVFIFTSRAEACPNMVLESMGHGCFCISSDHDPMPEFYGDAALYYAWGNADELTTRIVRALKMNEEERQVWKTRCLMQIEKFTWEKTARNTLISLEKAILEK